MSFNDIVTPTVGTRVRMRRDIDRYPHFMVAAGETGTVVTSDDQSFGVKMDQHIVGCEEWENEVIWQEWEFDEICDDVEIVR